MVKFKVEIERPLCISCGNCIDICPEFFEFADDGLSHLKDSKRVNDNDEIELDEAECTTQAEESCPVECIHVYEI